VYERSLYLESLSLSRCQPIAPLNHDYKIIYLLYTCDASFRRLGSVGSLFTRVEAKHSKWVLSPVYQLGKKH
jgi:hypothetical protein